MNLLNNFRTGQSSRGTHGSVAGPGPTTRSGLIPRVDGCTNCDGAGFVRDWDYPTPDGMSELGTCPHCTPTTQIVIKELLK